MSESALDLRSIRRVLLVELNRLGDVVHALPAVRAFKEAMPDAVISMVVEQPHHELVSLMPSADRVIEGDRTRTVAGLLKIIRQVRRERFDLVCSLSPIRRNALLARFARGRYKAGYLTVWRRIPPHLRRTPVIARGFRLARKELYGFDHISTAASKVCVALGLSVSAGRITLRSADHELMPGNSYIVFHPFAGWKFREWPENLAREFLMGVLQSTDFSVVIIGDRMEERRARGLSAGVDGTGRVQVRAGLAIPELMELISRAAAFVGTDSGPYQLCALLGKPAVGLFGPNSPEITGSRVDGSRILYHKLECSPCDQRRCIRPGAACMMQITPDEVLVTMRELIRR